MSRLQPWCTTCSLTACTSPSEVPEPRRQQLWFVAWTRGANRSHAGLSLACSILGAWVAFSPKPQKLNSRHHTNHGNPHRGRLSVVGHGMRNRLSDTRQSAESKTLLNLLPQLYLDVDAGHTQTPLRCTQAVCVSMVIFACILGARGNHL